jgi:hypothetical protein
MAGKMTNLRNSWLIALCLGTAVMFFAQVMLCAADDAGLVPCSQTASQNDRSSVPEKSGEILDSHDCHCGSHTSLLLLAETAYLGGEFQNHAFFDKNDFVPEAPVHEIDYPPQLS